MNSNKSMNTQMVMIFLSLIVIGASIFLLGMDVGGAKNGISQAKQVEALAINADDDPAMGPLNAPIEVIEFSDFQCPYCRSFFTETLPQIKVNYIEKGLVHFVYRDLPLTALGHKDALPAANAAECARKQGGDEVYFSFHDKIFNGEAELGFGTVPIPSENLYRYAEELNLDMKKFRSCQENLNFLSEIQQDIAVADSNGLNGTPTFAINGEILVGAQPYEVFANIFDDILNN